MEINEILIILMFMSFIGLLLLGLPIAWVLGGIGVVFAALGYLADTYFDTITGLDYLTLGLIVNRLFKLMSNWVLVALPLFIYMGIMLDKSAMAERLMRNMQRILGQTKGGLALCIVFIGVLLAASTGIIGASVVLLGMLSLPVMMEQKYSKELACGTISAAGCLGILIPPSIMLVIMADQLSLSVGDLFMGAVFPGILLSFLYLSYLLILGKLKPELMPLPNEEEEHLNRGQIIKDAIISILAPLSLMIAVLGSIFMGIATPTEASGIGAFGATFLAWRAGKLNFKILRDVAHETMRTTGFIFAIFVGATCFALVLRELGGDEFIEGLLQGLSLPPYGLLTFVLLFVFLLGFFLDWIEISLIILPLIAPVMSSLEFSLVDGQLENGTLIWFAILMAITLQTSFLTPPVGFALFYLKGICPPEIGLKHIYRGIIPFVLLQILALILVIVFPGLVTWLPQVAY